MPGGRLLGVGVDIGVLFWSVSLCFTRRRDLVGQRMLCWLGQRLMGCLQEPHTHEEEGGCFRVIHAILEEASCED